MQNNEPPLTGGKAKPLKAPKKEKKELDEDELAYREKQKAGTFFRRSSLRLDFIRDRERFLRRS